MTKTFDHRTIGVVDGFIYLVDEEDSGAMNEYTIGNYPPGTHSIRNITHYY